MKTFINCHIGALGDFILTLPALQSLRNSLGKIHLLGLGRPDYMQLAVAFGLLDSYLDFESRIMIDFLDGASLPPEIDSVAGGVFWFANAGKPISLLKKKAILPVIEIPPIPLPGMHTAQYYFKTVQTHFRLTTPFVHSFCLASDVPHHHSALIHPGSGSPRKNYSLQFYRDIADELARLGYVDVRFIFGPVERETINPHDLSGARIEQPENAAALAQLLAGAALYIGNDSGVSHLSGILGTRTIALYKNTDPRVWGALGQEVKHIVAADERTAFSEIMRVLGNEQDWQVLEK
ncbi:hypothetical protein JXJ21_17135 [candidate division KSB1 bacterium]|nr:hypothetical protein [candidate division KSB1 bacterium]